MTNSRLPLVLVAAVARNGAIGGEGRLLWRLKSDMLRFREITIGKPVIMGRKTWESIARPLPGRAVIVLTRDESYQAVGVDVVCDLPAAIALAEEKARTLAADEIVVAGGGEVYRQTIDRASRLRVTEVDLVPEADAYFPRFDKDLWKEVWREGHPAGDKDECAFAFVDYERRG